ncbi:cytochrome c-type biogenesis protein [Phaeobacter gallaeciensis]|uniref:cytochrome c-type biogenesis protein n=1 Tax=Phaeobacter gallaeciensis TaxID=60890 RepID=UPI00237F01A5|nr:cytochrome c-type biogenesis protein [Phaeobacter gallaeciensis]MDE4099612.1 cytochrome c-type biogenesis protein CcmH [Phaeobacter gallaeciensis]MDE4108324.1 cytochrome c-type biogenesis protein CcmH [Phaeobacter gallaeciensis]MDE4112689.1 cytochrome c-type biogenesis protein CcmH [Phaeobacter gallaeciensis]MDE4117159.1 cytochrome c-type biogenesis protein CcmH [Phaeobacter gallaeciensis]MDE4121631.1 cytochrome c-type biogenesis protein CcmH [Phaeobacter gallaeciensis]
MRQLIFALCIGALPFAANAVEPDEMLTDPLLEQRAREISKDLRCVVCQNQDIDSSNAGVARDLRLLVRERLVAGDTDTQVIEYIRARYGDYVLLKPPIEPATYALWFAPIAFVLIGVFVGGGVLMSSRRQAAIKDLDAEDEQTVSDILSQNKAGDAS